MRNKKYKDLSNHNLKNTAYTFKIYYYKIRTHKEFISSGLVDDIKMRTLTLLNFVAG